MAENLILSFYTVTWAVLFFFFYKRNKNLGLGELLLAVYGVSGIFSIIYFNAIKIIGYAHKVAPIRIESTLYFMGCSLICIIPFLRHGKSLRTISVKRQINTEVLNAILFFFLPFLLYYFLSLAYLAISIDPNSMGNIYETNYGSNTTSINVPWFARRVQEVLGWTTFIWPIILFECLRSEKLKSKSWIPLVAILCPFLSSYIYASRTIMMRELMYVAIVFFFYKNAFKRDVYIKVLKYSLICIGIVVIFMIFITSSRYEGMNTSMTAFQWVSLYGGSGVVNFSQYIWDLTRTSNGDTCFSLIKSFFGVDIFIDNTSRQEYYSNYFSVPVYIFHSMVGDFYQDFGRIGTPLFLMMFAFLEDRVLSNAIRKKTIGLFEVMILSVISLVVMFGIMYYVFKVYDTQINLLINIVMMLIFVGIVNQKDSYYLR